jgi:DNA-binding transcriptional regulator YiaG
MTFKELRQQSGMSRPQFVEYFDIPYRTVQSWELEDRQCPDYLIRLMEYKLRNEGFIE